MSLSVDNAETVHGGSGTDTIHVTSATIDATIDGGSSGKSTLAVSGGGTMTMGANITDIATASLASATAAYNFTANGEVGLVVNDHGTGIDTIAAGGLGQTLTGGAAGKLTMIGFAGGGTEFKDTSGLFNKDTIAGFTALGDILNITNLNSASVTGTFTENSAGTEGSLKLTDGTHSATIQLLGQFAAAGFSGGLASAGFTVSTDVSGGSDILFAPPHV